MGRRASLLLAVPMVAWHAVGFASSAGTLRTDVLRISASMLGAANLHLDEAQAQLQTSRPLDGTESFDIVPRWRAGEAVPGLPLVFDLVATVPPVTATLVTTLQREVLVARRRLERGAVVSCDDVEAQRRPVRTIPPRSLQPPCRMGDRQSTLRTLLGGDVVRDGDVGEPPEVSANGMVQVRVVQGAVVLEQPGTALSDGRVGEQVRVRLNGSRQQVVGRVGAARVVTVEGSQ